MQVYTWEMTQGLGDVGLCERSSMSDVLNQKYQDALWHLLSPQKHVLDVHCFMEL